MGCCKVGWKTKAEAEPWVEEHNEYYAKSIYEGKAPKAIGVEWCGDCKEWHIVVEKMKVIKSFIRRIFNRT